jgi:hypothetical protein
MDLDPLILLIDLLAIYRLTRLVTKDSLLDTPRHWLLQRWPSELTTYPENIVSDREMTDVGLIGKLPTGIAVYLDEEGWKALEPKKWPELLECPYCASVWLAFAVLAMRVWWDWWQYPAIALALAGGVALIFSRWDNE